MVGPGTGIAPFRSFWQQRFFEVSKTGGNQSFGKMVLFFGCRNKDQDNIYGSELNEAKSQGVLTDLLIGYSRQPGEQRVIFLLLFLKSRSFHM